MKHRDAAEAENANLRSLLRRLVTSGVPTTADGQALFEEASRELERDSYAS